MLIARKVLEEYLDKQNKNFLFKSEKRDSFLAYVSTKYNLHGKFIDLFSKRVSIEEQPDVILFIYVDGIDYVAKSNLKGKYFTEIEIQKYSEYRYEKEKIKFPIKFQCYPVGSDQWIGVIDSSVLFELQDADLIHYNERTQRVMQMIKKGKLVQFVITVNKSAVAKIRELMAKRIYIPDDITLNIPHDSEHSFYYDNSERCLVVTDLERFDITDGYHRFLAMKQQRQLDPNFSNTMELRITNFSEEKCLQFIYQKDQKTKMSKIDSDSMNISSPANIVVERLNADPRFLMQGEISRNKGKIPYAGLSFIIQQLYFKDKKGVTNKIIADVQKEVRDILNSLIEDNERYFSEGFSYKELVLAMCVYEMYGYQNVMRPAELIERLVSSEEYSEIKRNVEARRLLPSDVKKIKEYIREVKEHV